MTNQNRNELIHRITDEHHGYYKVVQVRHETLPYLEVAQKEHIGKDEVYHFMLVEQFAKRHGIPYKTEGQGSDTLVTLNDERWKLEGMGEAKIIKGQEPIIIFGSSMGYKLDASEQHVIDLDKIVKDHSFVYNYGEP